jgi:hypothetical protein
METGDEAWNGHRWLQPQPRRLEIESGASVLQRHCVKCGRDFISELSSGSRYAVFVSATSFFRLADEITERWLKETCPGERALSDNEDRNQRKTRYIVSTASLPASELEPAPREWHTIRGW